MMKQTFDWFAKENQINDYLAKHTECWIASWHPTTDESGATNGYAVEIREASQK